VVVAATAPEPVAPTAAPRESPPKVDATAPSPLPPPEGKEPNSRGPLDAAVVLVEFSDFECPYSRRAAAEVESAISPYSDRVRWVFKSFPLPFHPHAHLAHEAALAAGEWDLFWEMRARIFATDVPLTREVLVRLAVEIGIPAEDFASVLDSRYFEAAVEREVEEGRALGVRGTPTFFVNGRRLVGALPRAALDHVVRRALGLRAESPPDFPAEILASDPEEEHPFGFGDPRAPRVLKVFVDLRSPFGERAVPLVEELVRRGGEQFRVVVKCRPLGIDADGPLAHQAAIALDERGVDFFEVWRRVLAAPRSRVTAAAVEEWALELGLDGATAADVASELERGAHGSRVDADVEHAKLLGVRGAPAAVFLGVRFDGLEGLRALRDALDRETGAAPPDRDAGRDAAGAGTPSAPVCHEKGAGSHLHLAVPAEPQALVAAQSFGVAAEGALVTRRFEVLNDGEEPLSLRVAFAPPAAEVSLPPQPIAPGASGAVDVRLRTAGAGEVALPIVLAPPAGDGGGTGARAYRRLLLKGRVSDAVSVAPAGGLRLETVAGRAERAQGALHVTSRDERLSRLEVARAEPQGIDVEVETFEPAAGGDSGSQRAFSVRVTAPARPDPGRLSGVIVLATDHPEVREIAAALELVVHDELVVTPARLRLGGAGHERGSRQGGTWLRIRRPDGGFLAIRSAHATLPRVRVVPEAAPAEVEHRLLVDASGAPPGDALRGEVVVEAVLIEEEGPRARTVRVPIGE
jgi:protein-disulfide isomerase